VRVTCSPMMILLASLPALAAVAGCNYAPGNPAHEAAVPQPNTVTNFDALYQQNCAGCHGTHGQGGAANGLESGVYLVIADDSTIRRVTAEGVSGTSMPAFAQSSGGMLTDAQINSIVKGIRERGTIANLEGAVPPSYAAKTPGDAKRGAEVYNTFCSSCHGPGGSGTTKASSIVDAAYLTLVSDQYLRTVVITGRPELGAPDWRADVPGRPMSEADVSDVVAWLSAQRPERQGETASRVNSTNAYTGATQ
jgi:cytochrome c oxidase cbb3-type subunit III